MYMTKEILQRISFLRAGIHFDNLCDVRLRWYEQLIYSDAIRPRLFYYVL